MKVWRVMTLGAAAMTMIASDLERGLMKKSQLERRVKEGGLLTPLVAMAGAHSPFLLAFLRGTTCQASGGKAAPQAKRQFDRRSPTESEGALHAHDVSVAIKRS
mmetsp:Transcript_29831/g.72638  ORF Transcript_29831/g.72638 Transcript_29831/m.72638 type:complete len:104 (+) Transcript_29831:834-1145(+)